VLRDASLQSLQSPQSLGPVSPDALNIACKHLFWPKSGGVFLHGDDLTDRTLLAAWKQLGKQPAPQADSEDEGVVAELTA
jgi:hypothetical protein